MAKLMVMAMETIIRMDNKTKFHKIYKISKYKMKALQKEGKNIIKHDSILMILKRTLNMKQSSNLILKD